jgi:stringent starvation protein B
MAKIFRYYMIKSILDWLHVQSWTPYLWVKCDNTVQVPQKYVSDHHITLSLKKTAIANFSLDKHCLTFEGSFEGVVQHVMLPLLAIVRCYAKEYPGYGISFLSQGEGMVTGPEHVAIEDVQPSVSFELLDANDTSP